MDLSAEIAANFYALLFVSIPFGVFQRFVGGGARTTERTLGYVAETCPKCNSAQPFSLKRLGIANAFLFKPMTPGVLLGHFGVCRKCSGEIDLQVTDYPAIETDEKVPLGPLRKKTNPTLGSGDTAARAAFERFGRIRAPLADASQALSFKGGFGGSFAQGAAFVVAFELVYWIARAFSGEPPLPALLALFVAAFVPMQWLGQRMMDRHGSRFQYGTGPSALFVLSAAAMALAVVGSVSPEICVGLGMLALAVSVILVLIEPRQFFDTEVKPKLASSLVALKPTLEELDGCIRRLRQHGEPCRFVDAQALLKDIAAAEAHIAAHPASTAGPAAIVSGLQGECPNCGSRIPLESAECPIPKCGAVFGEGSAWKIKPV